MPLDGRSSVLKGRSRPGARVRRTFSRLKDFRRVATRYDKLANTYAATVYLAAIVIWWL